MLLVKEVCVYPNYEIILIVFLYFETSRHLYNAYLSTVTSYQLSTIQGSRNLKKEGV